jgi:hypothetical protein
LKEAQLQRKCVAKWNLDDLTDAAIHSAIRYLDPDEEANVQDDGNGFIIAISVMILLLGCIGLISFYQWAH